MQLPSDFAGRRHRGLVVGPDHNCRGYRTTVLASAPLRREVTARTPIAVPFVWMTPPPAMVDLPGRPDAWLATISVYLGLLVIPTVLWWRSRNATHHQLGNTVQTR